MKIQLLALAFVMCTHNLGAQNWELHLGSGLSYARLIPVTRSTTQAENVRYGFSAPRLYFSPQLDFKVNDHSRFSIGYQVSDNLVGMQFGGRTGTLGGREYNADGITLHNVSVGYSFRHQVLNNHLQVGGFAKAGLVYGQMTSISGGSISGYGEYGTFYSQITRETDFEVMPNFWAPASTLGFVAGPVFKGTRLADRLTFNLAATVVWKNPYVTPTQASYTIVAPSGVQEGIATLEGMPLQLQFGIDYNLFRFGKGDR